MTKEARRSSRVKKTPVWQEEYKTFQLGDGMANSIGDTKWNMLSLVRVPGA